MSNKQDKNVTEKLNEVYGDLETEAFVEKLQRTGKNVKEDHRGTLTSEGEPRFTMDEWLDKVKNMKYHQPIYKELKLILSAPEHDNWKHRAPGGAFKKGNPYRFTKD
jgi:DNA-binding transcriptional regulator YhcF (GntR family)